MHDIVIRGGTIMDGTGKAAFSGDVAIAEGRITGVGGKQGPARREIDATGLMVTPGWVYVRTHYAFAHDPPGRQLQPRGRRPKLAKLKCPIERL